MSDLMEQQGLVDEDKPYPARRLPFDNRRQLGQRDGPAGVDLQQVGAIQFQR
jgi:hypothetical protein